jgi:methylenetetrahydrofolate reductase (NADPH)
MEVARLYKDPKNWPVLSAETFPTQNFRPIDPVLEAVEQLLPHGIRVITTTWGALGSARGGTTSLSRIIRDRFDVPTVVHLSIQAKSRQDIEGILRGMYLDDLHNVLALGGDPPEGRVDYVPADQRHGHARDLVEQIANLNRGQWLGLDGTYSQSGMATHFGVGVAGFPEVHPEDFAATGDFDRGMDRYLGFLKRKVESGADYVIEQMIFDADLHFDFVSRARAAGIHVPIIPGIMPFEHLDQVERFLGDQLRISMPAEIMGTLRGLSDEDQAEVATEYMAGQVRTLLESGAPGIHFYCMNRSEPTIRVLERARA